MKAITIWQPWASLIGIGAKTDETRNWATSYRGPIAIHAAKVNPFKAIHSVPDDVVNVMKETLRASDVIPQQRDFRYLPIGAVVATATLSECLRVIKHTPTAIVLRQSNGVGEDKIPIDAPYLVFGDYSVGRYIWSLSEIRVLPEPIPVKGKQGLWNWEETENV